MSESNDFNETALSRVIEYASEHFEAFVGKLEDLVRIPSVSFDGFPAAEVERSAEAVATLLREGGLENVEILRIPGAHPAVYGDWLHAAGRPTLLLYAHHDVQPPGRPEKWRTPPFDPTRVGDRLFGRGAADDKAGILVHTSAIASFLKTAGSLPVNVKLFIEGEEEVGSSHLETFLKQYRPKLEADVMVLTDTGNFDVGLPSITISLRGLVAVEVEVRVMDHPMHSGFAGGPGPDPVVALAKMIASLVDASGRIAIAGIYEKVRPVGPAEKESMDALHFSQEDYRKRVQLLPGVQTIGGDEPVLQKLWRLPALSVNAIQASSKAQVSNVINESAWCKIGIRTVPDMDGEKTLAMLCDHLKRNAPWGVELHLKPDSVAPWWFTSPSAPAYECAREALTRAFGRDCVYVGEGGTIPFVTPFSEVLGGAPALLIGVEDPYTNAHSENESVHLGDLKKSMLGAIYLYEGLNALSRGKGALGGREILFFAFSLTWRNW